MMCPRDRSDTANASIRMFGERAHETGFSLPVKVRGMATRVVARAVRRKTLALREMPPMVSFTFDDVPSSACRAGARILERHGVRGTFYVAAGGCGAISPVGQLASRDEIRTLAANGHEIGCHTYSHPDVSRITLVALDNEIDQNRSALLGIHGDIVLRNFAYPYGEMSVRSKRRLETRFDSCRSVHPGINSKTADLGSLKACPLESAAVDHAKIARLIEQTIETNGWLIFYSHDVSEHPSPFGVAPGTLDFAVRAAKKAGCIVATISRGLDLINCATGKARRAVPA